MASGRLSKVRGKVLDIPNPPTIGTATAGGESVSIAFTADSSGKGGPTRSYIAKSNPGNITATGSTSPINVTGLTEGTAYTISVAGVNETGTSEYSSASSSVTALAGGAYESIATVTVGSGGAANVEFTSIPSTYKHLQIRGLARIATGGSSGIIQFNSDTTTTNYYHHGIEGLGSGTPGAFASNQFPFIISIPSTANTFAVTVTDILDYANTNKYKTLRIINGQDKSGSGELYLVSGLWKNTNAVTQILIKPNTSSFSQYTQFALYGIKG